MPMRNHQHGKSFFALCLSITMILSMTVAGIALFTDNSDIVPNYKAA